MEQETLLSSLKVKRPIYEFSLDNGLKILICPRPKTKIVCSMIWYHVGSSNEIPGETGISHFLEHLMFKGTNRYKKGEIDLLTQIYGGVNNASTHQDFTNYYFNFAADRFEVALEIEANRMKNCLFEETEFQAEKMVVIDELMQGKDSPWNMLDEEVYQLSYRVHPYQRPIIGWKEDLIRVTPAQVKAYYQKYYQPNNATVVIVGDVSVEETKAKIQNIFGGIPAGDPITPLFPVEPLQLGERRSLLELDVKARRLSMAFHTCTIGHQDDYCLDVLDNILSYGKSSLFYQKLVETEKTCRFIFSNNETNKSPGLYWISAELLPEASPEKVEQSIFEELERLKEELVSPKVLSKAKNIALAHHIFACESCEALAYSLGMWDNATSHKDYEQYLDHIQKVTPESLRETARRYFHDTNKSIALSLPKKNSVATPSQKELELEISKSEVSAVEEKETTPKVSSVSVPKLPDPNTVEGLVLDRNRMVLKNGLILLHHHNPVLPIVHINCFIRASQRYEPKEQAGIASLTGAMMLQGTEHRSAVEIAQAIESTGSVLEPSSGGISCKTLASNLPLALELISDCLQFPAFPEAAIEKERNKMRAELRSIQDNCRRKTQQAFYQKIYGEHPFGRHSYGTEETLDQLSQNELKQHHKNFYTPNNTMIAVSGDISQEELLKLIERYFGAWNSQELSLPETPLIVPQEEKEIITIPMEREQLNIYLGHLGVKRDNPDYHKMIVMDHLLGTGAGFTDRISQKLRDEMGLAYSVYANISESAGIEPGVFACFIATDPRNGEKAIQEILRQINLFKEKPVSLEELQRVQSYLSGSYVFSFERNAQITRHMIQMERFQLQENYLQDYLRDILLATPEEIRQVAQKYLNTEAYTLVLGGKTEGIALP